MNTESVVEIKKECFDDDDSNIGSCLVPMKVEQTCYKEDEDENNVKCEIIIEEEEFDFCDVKLESYEELKMESGFYMIEVRNYIHLFF